MIPEKEQKKLFEFNPNASEFLPSVAPKDHLCTFGQGSRSHSLNPDAREFISAKFFSCSDLRILNPNASVFVPSSFVSTQSPQARVCMVPFSPVYVLIGVKPRRRPAPVLLNPTS